MSRKKGPVVTIKKEKPVSDYDPNIDDEEQYYLPQFDGKIDPEEKKKWKELNQNTVDEEVSNEPEESQLALQEVLKEALKKVPELVNKNAVACHIRTVKVKKGDREIHYYTVTFSYDPKKNKEPYVYRVKKVINEGIFY